MNVIDYLHAGWFLLEEKEDLYLDVNCSYSAFSYEMLIKLTADEKALFKSDGRKFIERLAKEVQDHGMTKYKVRNISSTLGSNSHEAIMAWKESSKNT